jgi:RHH-type proline utilization regulon transcriptional repressor/proline dehydrogenase/delta 1-pyrroline-5-carboxylate dehydrogenase
VEFYRALIRAYADSGRRAPLYLSLKLSALVDDLPAALGPRGKAKRQEILARLRRLLDDSAGLNPTVFIRIDMEEFAYKDLTLGLFRELVEVAPLATRDAEGQLRVGIVIQAYLRESASDVAALAEWAQAHGVRVPVRLVKGAYADKEKALARAEGRQSPVWNAKSSTDASYLLIAEALLRRREVFAPAFATHNMSTQAHVMRLAQGLGMPVEKIEFQMLYGMGDPIKQALVSLGYPVREYVPAGPLHRGLGYAGRRFAELTNPDNALARTLRGDYSVLATEPAFVVAEDSEDGRAAREWLLPDREG